MAEREYLDVDIPLNLKEGGIVGNGPGNDARIVSHGSDVLRDQANHIIRGYVEKYRAQGWMPERSIDLLQIHRDRHLNYKGHLAHAQARAHLGGHHVSPRYQVTHAPHEPHEREETTRPSPPS